MAENRRIKSAVEAKSIDDNRIDEVIGEIFKIESTALGIQSDTEREKEEYARTIERQTKEFDEKLAEETAKKVEALKVQLNSEKEKEMSARRDGVLKYTAKMDELYAANHEIWLKDIVKNILKE